MLTDVAAELVIKYEQHNRLKKPNSLHDKDLTILRRRVSIIQISIVTEPWAALCLYKSYLFVGQSFFVSPHFAVI